VREYPRSPGSYIIFDFLWSLKQLNIVNGGNGSSRLGRVWHVPLGSSMRVQTRAHAAHAKSRGTRKQLAAPFLVCPQYHLWFDSVLLVSHLSQGEQPSSPTALQLRAVSVAPGRPWGSPAQQPRHAALHIRHCSCPHPW
jgi:hypothetical protein